MSLTRRNLLGATGALTALAVAGPVLAQTELTAEQRRLVERAQTYMNTLRAVLGEAWGISLPALDVPQDEFLLGRQYRDRRPES